MRLLSAVIRFLIVLIAKRQTEQPSPDYLHRHRERGAMTESAEDQLEDYSAGLWLHDLSIDPATRVAGG